MNFGKLRMKCVEQDKSIYQVCKEAGIGKSSAMKLNQDKNMSMEIIDRLCSYFHCQPSDIMELSNQN